MAALIGSMAAAHLLLVLLTLWVARPVIVLDDDYLLIAQLLKGPFSDAAPPDGEEFCLPKRTELASAIIRAGEEAKEGLTPLPSAGNLRDVGATIGDDAHGEGAQESPEQGSPEQGREDNAGEIGDQGLPMERIAHVDDMV